MWLIERPPICFGRFSSFQPFCPLLIGLLPALQPALLPALLTAFLSAFGPLPFNGGFSEGIGQKLIQCHDSCHSVHYDQCADGVANPNRCVLERRLTKELVPSRQTISLRDGLYCPDEPAIRRTFYQRNLINCPYGQPDEDHKVHRHQRFGDTPDCRSFVLQRRCQENQQPDERSLYSANHFTKRQRHSA